MAKTSLPLWDWPTLCRALQLVDSQTKPVNVFGLAFDSRKVQPGDLFVALPGDPGPKFTVTQRSNRDGHHYIDQALANGAAAVMTHDGTSRESPQLAVADTLDGLWQLARYRRDQSPAPRVAITGSSGKTTAKTFMAAAIGDHRTHASQGSFNNHLGVPLSLATLPLSASYGVFEIGTNHPGEIGPLSRLVMPQVAVLLNVHSAHLENFPNRAGLVAEKLAIAEGLDEHGVLVVEDQVPVPATISRRVKVIRFGESAAADVRLLGVATVQGQPLARYQVGSQTLQAHLPGGGHHRALTLAAVLAVLEALSLDLALACQLPQSLIPAGRGNRQNIKRGTLIDDSYNANPQSMQAALQGLVDGKVPGGRQFALLGEMLELGEHSAAAHGNLRPVCEQLDGVWLVGPGFAALANQLPDELCLGYWPDMQAAAARQELLQSVKAHLGDSVELLVKGSNRVFWQHDVVGELLRELQ